MSRETPPKGRIKAWRFAVGVMIHLYPVVVAVAILAYMIAEGTGMSWDGIVRADLAVVGLVFVGWAIATVAVGFGTAATSAILQRREEWRLRNDPAEALRLDAERLDRSLDVLSKLARDRGSTVLSDAVVRLVDLARDGWDHADPRFARITRDIEQAATILPEGFKEAEGRVAEEAENRAAIAMSTLAAAAEEVHADRGRSGAERTREFADYVSTSYGTLLGPIR